MVGDMIDILLEFIEKNQKLIIVISSLIGIGIARLILYLISMS